jgi:transcriptional regulator
MYLPDEFVVDDPELTWRVIEENPFGVLFEPKGPQIVHLPFLVDRTRPGTARILSHVGRRNAVARSVDGKRLFAVFTGPHAHVTPRWYEKPQRQVPTWNYVVVEVCGWARALDDGELRVLLGDLCARFEPPNGYRPDWIDEAYLTRLSEHIVGFEIAVEKAQGKFKLSQNRTAEDRDRIMRGLEDRNEAGDRGVLEWMRRLLR